MREPGAEENLMKVFAKIKWFLVILLVTLRMLQDVLFDYS